MKTVSMIALVLLLAGCASAPSRTASGAQTYTGEVRNVNSKDNIVSLWQPTGGLIHVKTAPDQYRGLQIGDKATVQGVLAEPAVATIVTPGPMTPVPRGTADVTELSGNVTSVESTGRLTANTDRGPIRVIVANGADQRFNVSAPVTVRISVQQVDMVASSTAAGPGATPSAMPGASPTSEPGDHAVSTGRVLSVSPTGVLVAEAPSGPVQVVVANPSRYKIGDFVQVRTTTRATP